MIKKEELIKEYSKAIQEGNAAVFAGAGLSRASGYVNWKELVKPFADYINLDVEKEHDLVAVAQYYRNRRRTRHDINQNIMNQFTKGVQINDNIKILSELPIFTYWTTNYDNLIETGLRQANKNPDVKTNSKQLSLTRNNRDAVIYKMHGDAENPSDAVLTKDDYETYDEKRPLFRTALQGDLISKTFLFIGFSFEDPNLDYVLSRIHSLLGENGRTHYCFFKYVEQDSEESDSDFTYRKARQELQTEDLERYGIQTVYVKNYEEITEILYEISMSVKLNKVFISGSANEFTKPWNQENAEALMYSLAKALVKNNYQITSGFGLGVGAAVVNGALEEIYSTKFKHIDENLCLRPFPYAVKDRDERQIKFTKYREDMISDVGIAIFMFGNKQDEHGNTINATGCMEEFDIAKRKNKFIIPLGSTGYAAKKILDEIKKDVDKYIYLKNYVAALETTTDVNELVALTMKIIEDCKKTF